MEKTIAVPRNKPALTMFVGTHVPQMMIVVKEKFVSMKNVQKAADQTMIVVGARYATPRFHRVLVVGNAKRVLARVAHQNGELGGRAYAPKMEFAFIV